MIQRYGWLALVLLLSASPAFAQTDAAVNTVKQYFAQNARYSAGDLDNLATTDAYTSRRTGATYVYLRQTHNGLEVVNATGQAAVARDGRIIAPIDRFVPGLAERVNTDTPSLFEYAAASQAISHLRRTASEWQAAHATHAVADGPSDYMPAAADHVAADYFTLVDGSARQVYFVTERVTENGVEAGDVRLAWELELEARDQQHHFLVRVDAENGRVLSQADLVSHDNWTPSAIQGGRMEPTGPVRSIVEVAPAASSSIGSYRVFAMPVESPGHGPQTLVANPDDATASPLGWHDTGSTSYTITRGNNVHAYLDLNNTGNPTPADSPDGGAGLVFDFPYTPGTQPIDMKEAAVTNLFYWNNIIHDVLYHYGFDEPGGNFQINTFGNGGLGNDDVRAEAQDGGGINNANFFTPSDGQRPRMQMYLWNGPTPFEVLTPPSIAGTYNSLIAGFGPQAPPGAAMAGDIVLVDDGTAEGQRGCNALINGGELAGKIALIERGDCEFGVKVLNAEMAGAVGAVVYNCDPAICTTSANTGENIFSMGAGAQGGNVTIPSYMVPRSLGLAMSAELPGVTVNVSGESVPFDGDYDNGIVVHEYGHGISNRLTGGPGASGCLGNAEQMGEGWSDYYGMMMTMKTGDMGPDPRGVGTWVSIQPTTGNGIRPAPYSTDQSINDFTYQDSRTQAVPHGVGFVWATALWEATWDMIDAHGFSPDLYNASGTAGNQVMMQLVTEAMKLQPCSPGFVDGRDAILEADTLIYNGVYSDILWGAFARRGLGAFASQGSSNSNADNTEDFSLPTDTPPSAAVDPLSFSFSVPRGDSEQATMTVQNVGAGNLVWNLGNTPSWLSANPSSGTIAAGATTTVTFTASPGNLPQNTYNATVELATNSPTTPSFSLDMEMEVLRGVGVEGDLEFPGTHLLSDVYPNPFNPQATFTLAVAQAQDVRIELYDALGRRVALLHEGALAGRSNHTFQVDGSALTSGTYFVRIAGETFAETRRVTLLK